MRLSQTDASFIYMESASGPMHISSVYVLDGEVPFGDIFYRFERRIHLIPSYRRKLANVPFSLGHPKWVDDPAFDLANHVVHELLPPDSTLQQGVDRAVELNEPLLDRSRPLWKMVVIEGVPGKTLLLQMTHHAMIDGASGIELTTILYDLSAKTEEPVPPNEPWQAEPGSSQAEMMSEAIQENMARFSPQRTMELMTSASSHVAEFRKATEIMTRFVTRPAITAPFNAGLVGPKRQVRWVKKPFSEIREIRRFLGGTINDVVLTVVSEAVARYLELHGESVKDQHMRIMCPVNVRTETKKGALGNQVSAIFPMLPAWSMDPVARLGVVVGETERIKNDQEAQALTVMQENMPEFPPVAMAASQLIGTPLDPTALAARVPLPVMPGFGGRPPNVGVNFTCTNVPGVQVPQYMCGAEVTDTIGLLVLTGTTGFSVTILSYNQQLFFNFICEPRLLPDLDVIRDGAEAVFNEMLAVATQRAQLALENIK